MRNFTKQQWQFCSGLNCITGANGTGKTGILEAIHILGVGRSFRSSSLAHVIEHEFKEVVLHAKLEGEDTITANSIGFRKQRQGAAEFRINQDKVQQLSQCAQLLPIQFLSPDSFKLITDGPAVRRKFMDWGVFHNSQDFIVANQAYQRALKHCNALYKSRNAHLIRELEPWLHELAKWGEAIHNFRKSYLADLLPQLAILLGQFPELPTVESEYWRGWSDEQSLGVALEKASARDRICGSVSVGPHRADLRFNYLNLPIYQVLSRGQQKRLAYAMQIAQGALLKTRSGKPCLYLVDDLGAELDKSGRGLVLKLLHEQGGQLFVTSIDSLSVLPHIPESLEYKHLDLSELLVVDECST